MRALFSYFPIPLRKNDTENISLIELWSLRGFVDTLTANEIALWGFWGFAVLYSNGIIWKSEKIFWSFCSIYRISVNFQIFSKERRSWKLTYFRNYTLSKTWLIHSNLLFPMQVQLSLKESTFSQVFVPLIKSPSNLKDFRKKHDSDS